MERIIKRQRVEAPLFVVITIGTAGEAVLQVVRRKLRHYVDFNGVEVRSIDTDGTGQLPFVAAPLISNGTVDGWGPQTRLLLQLPSRDHVAAVNRGQRRGIADGIHPEALRLLQGHDGTGAGGIIPLARIAGVFNWREIEGSLRQALSRCTAAVREQAPDEQPHLHIAYVESYYGSTAIGAGPLVHDRVVALCRNLGVEPRFFRIVSVPGIHPAKDMEAAEANAYAALKRDAARSTGRYVELVIDPDTGQRSYRLAQYVPTLYVSDASNAPGTVQSISPAQLHSTEAEFIASLLHTSFGRVLDARLADGVDDLQTRTSHGESRSAGSIGLSVISIDRERDLRWAIERHVVDTAAVLFGPEDPAGTANDVDDAVRAFIRRQDLMQGAGFEDLIHALLTYGDGEHPGEDLAERFARLFQNAIVRPIDLETLADLPDQRRLVEAQVDEEEREWIHFAAQNKREAVSAAIDQAINERLRRPGHGLRSAIHWMESLGTYLDRIIDRADEATRLHMEDARAHRERLEEIEQEGIPVFVEMGAVRRWANRREIEQLGSRYVSETRRLGSERVAERAGQAAVVVLNELRQHVHARLERLNTYADALHEAVEAAKTERDRIEAWDGVLVNPHGLRLDDDLLALYAQLIRQADESTAAGEDVPERAAQQTASFLQRATNLLERADEIDAILHHEATQRLSPLYEALHVQDLFRRRYPDDDILRRVLRERDRESWERLKLKGTTNHDHGEYVLRFVLGDNRHGQALVDLLNQGAAHGRRGGLAHYEFVDTGDPEKIVFIQIRLGFPISAIDKYDVYREAYNRRSVDLDFEKMHGEPVDRHLPEPGPPASTLDTQVALLQAYLVDGLKIGRGLSYEGMQDDVTHIDDQLAALQAYDLRVELVTRLYAVFREIGPEPLYDRLDQIDSLLETAEANGKESEDPVMTAVVAHVEQEALDEVRKQVAWWAHNTIPQAALWNSE